MNSQLKPPKSAIWAVRSAVKNTSYPKEINYFVGSISAIEAKSEYRKKYPDHTIWTFDFVNYEN